MGAGLKDVCGPVGVWVCECVMGNVCNAYNMGTGVNTSVLHP